MKPLEFKEEKTDRTVKRDYNKGDYRSDSNRTDYNRSDYNRRGGSSGYRGVSSRTQSQPTSNRYDELDSNQ